MDINRGWAERTENFLPRKNLLEMIIPPPTLSKTVKLSFPQTIFICLCDNMHTSKAFLSFAVRSPSKSWMHLLFFQIAVVAFFVLAIVLASIFIGSFQKETFAQVDSAWWFRQFPVDKDKLAITLV